MSRKSLVPIQLPADPTLALEAATKKYVDGLVGKFSYVQDATPTPPAGGTGLTWFKTDTAEAFVYYDNAWIEYAPGGDIPAGTNLIGSWTAGSVTLAAGATNVAAVTSPAVTLLAGRNYLVLVSWRANSANATPIQTSVKHAGGTELIDGWSSLDPGVSSGFGGMKSHHAIVTGTGVYGTFVLAFSLGAGAGSSQTIYSPRLTVIDLSSGSGSAAPGPWTNMTLETGWQPLANWPTPAYRLVGDVVELRGIVQRTAAVAATTLYAIWNPPVGFRPPGTFQGIWSSVGQGSSGEILATTRVQGNVLYYYAAGSPNLITATGYISLHGVSWSVS